MLVCYFIVMGSITDFGVVDWWYFHYSSSHFVCMLNENFKHRSAGGFQFFTCRDNIFTCVQGMTVLTPGLSEGHFLTLQSWFKYPKRVKLPRKELVCLVTNTQWGNVCLKQGKVTFKLIVAAHKWILLTGKKSCWIWVPKIF